MSSATDTESTGKKTSDQKINNPVTFQILTRTPNGQIYYNDLKTIFSVLVYCLDLKQYTKPSSSILKFHFKKQHQYSFSVGKAVKMMASLGMEIQHQVTSTVLSYSFKPDYAFELLELFYIAKFVHCPEEKTLKKITNNTVILQPTPKGVAVIHQFCSNMGVAHVKNLKMPEILQSSFNSMELMDLERHSRLDSINYNEHSSKLLFIKVMGSSMNIWSSKNGPDTIKNLGSNLVSNKSVNFQIHGTEAEMLNPLESEMAFHEYLRNRQKEVGFIINESRTSQNSSKHNGLGLDHEKPQYSPFYHRFFTNPDSDSHVQYYSSSCGLRFFKEKIITSKKGDRIIKNCFSGKAMIQYLMDCTNLAYQKEAVLVATKFLSIGLIQYENEKKYQGGFVASKEAIYTLTEVGYHLVKWDKPTGAIEPQTIVFTTTANTPLSLKTPGEVSLDMIIRDPGLKYLFRKFMNENICVENLNIYDELIDFDEKITMLKKLVFLKDKGKHAVIMDLKNDSSSKKSMTKQYNNMITSKKLKIYTAMNKLLEYCISKVYTIFALYISEDAPNAINIDSNLKFKITKLMEQNGNFHSSFMSLKELKNKIIASMSEDQPPRINTSKIEHVQITDTQGSEKRQDDMNIETAVYLETTTEVVSADKDIKTSLQNIEGGGIDGISHLRLDLKNVERHSQPNASPTETLFGPKLKFLIDISKFYGEIRAKVYMMMERDSYGKFLKSEQFKENYYSLIE